MSRTPIYLVGSRLEKGSSAMNADTERQNGSKTSAFIALPETIHHTGTVFPPPRKFTA